MAVKSRLNKPIRVVSLIGETELLDMLSYEQQQKYQLYRDLDSLPLADLKEPATIFTVIPLLPEMEYLLGAIEAGNTNLMRDFVRFHVLDVENFDGAQFEEKKGRKVLARETIDLLPLEVVRELAIVIQEGTTRGNTIPFSLQDSILGAKRQLELRNLFA